MHDLYDGAAHLRKIGVALISPLGQRVADLLAIWLDGLHHLKAAREVEWNNPYCIEVRWGRELSTFDNSLLTRLVLLCHERAIRLEISPRSRGYLTLLFHGRAHDAARMDKRHPTIQQALAHHLHPAGAAGETIVIAVHLDLAQREALANETEVTRRALALAGCPAAERWSAARQLVQRALGSDLVAERLRRIGAVLSEAYGDDYNPDPPLEIVLDLLPPASPDERAGLARLARAEWNLIDEARLRAYQLQDARLIAVVEELRAAMEGRDGR